MNAEKFFSLYIHVPFCESKCGYCSFYSEAGRLGDVDLYLSALELEAKKFLGSKIRTLYIGGGTPSVLNLSQWEKLSCIIKNNFDTSKITETTTEANPNSLTREHVKFFRENNFTRVSLGVQSLNNNELKILGRLHDESKAFRAMELVKNSGLVLSCDLIFAIPGQTLRTWEASLKNIMQYASHVSAYQLTLEPDTPLAKIFGDEDLNTMGYKFYRYAQFLLPRKNFTQYEISSFAPDSFECKHNIAYWNQDNVIALGPSAVSYIDGVRKKNPATLEKYFYAAKNNFPEELCEIERLSPREKIIERIILSLRTKWGVKISDLPPEISQTLSEMPHDLFLRTGENIALSPRGMRLGNAIWSEIIGL